MIIHQVSGSQSSKDIHHTQPFLAASSVQYLTVFFRLRLKFQFGLNLRKEFLTYPFSLYSCNILFDSRV